VLELGAQVEADPTEGTVGHGGEVRHPVRHRTDERHVTPEGHQAPPSRLYSIIHDVTFVIVMVVAVGTCTRV
jgi:hypothetical protein